MKRAFLPHAIMYLTAKVTIFPISIEHLNCRVKPPATAGGSDRTAWNVELNHPLPQVVLTGLRGTPDKADDRIMRLVTIPAQPSQR
jgi:hypothetical protein